MVNDDLVREAAGHLTDRDRQIIRLIARHRVLTTSQLARLFFTNLTTARHRLTVLWRLRLLDRFRPLAANPAAAGLHAGSYHYVLDELGGWMVHAEDGRAPDSFRWRRRRQGDDIAYARSQQLAHKVEVNEFFTRLLVRARHDDAATLLAWYSREHEREDAVWHWQTTPESYGVRPDGYGHWVEHDQDVAFWLELDRGTETLGVVTDKLERYGNRAFDLVKAGEHPDWVLVALPSGRRERHLHQALSNCHAAAAAAVWGAHVTPDAPIWRPLGSTDDQTPLRLADLGHAPLPRPLLDAVRAWRKQTYPTRYTVDDRAE